jgi:hypothetical protein
MQWLPQFDAWNGVVHGVGRCGGFHLRNVTMKVGVQCVSRWKVVGRVPAPYRIGIGGELWWAEEWEVHRPKIGVLASGWDNKTLLVVQG